MRSTRSLTRLTLVLLILTVPLAGCGTAELLRFLAGSETTTVVKTVCPKLDPPPEGALDALEAKMKEDPETALWVDKLDKHYEKLEQC